MGLDCLGLQQARYDWLRRSGHGSPFCAPLPLLSLLPLLPLPSLNLGLGLGLSLSSSAARQGDAQKASIPLQALPRQDLQGFAHLLDVSLGPHHGLLALLPLQEKRLAAALQRQAAAAKSVAVAGEEREGAEGEQGGAAGTRYRGEA